MANNRDNIKINSKPGYGYTLTRTSYDLHQEIGAKVIGVLKYNNGIREKLLKRNIGIYKQVNLDEGIGYISDLYFNESSKPLSLSGDGLLGYTHTNQSDYQKKINQKYNFGDFITYYQHGNLPDSINLNWKGLYNDYTQYIDEVYGYKTTTLNLLSDLFQVDKLKKNLKLPSSQENFLTIRSILNDLLQYDNLKYAMEKSRIGTVNPNPLAALEGAVTTNINNFSGTDTQLGLISNYLYAHTLRNGAQFNSLRKTKYITPSVYENLGNKLSTISTLASDFRIDDETGRLIYDLGYGYYQMRLDNLNDIEDIKEIDNIQNQYLYDNLSQNIRYSKEGKSITKNINGNTIELNSIFKGYTPFTEIIKNDKGEIVQSASSQYPWKILQSSDNLKLKQAIVKRTVGNTVYKTWNEGDTANELSNDVYYPSYDDAYSSIKEYETIDLLYKTDTLFKNHETETLIGRFHTSGDIDKGHNQVNLLQTAVTNFGLSHGRNLLTKKAYQEGKGDNVNGYDNPYCRTWTYHHQYDTMDKLIRPSGLSTLNWEKFGRRNGSIEKLKQHSVLNKNGFVNITPTNETDTTNSIDVKKCMFSIENLAWKDVFKSDNEQRNLSKEQQGPNGGRIMWFPPYGLTFNENIGVNWNSVDFIGRGERVYTYTNTERTGTLSFILLVDHPSVLDIWRKQEYEIDKNNYIGDGGEQTILRFFAGCDDFEINGKEGEEEYEDIEEYEELVKIEPEIVSEEKDNEIVFYIFFPNNYSGKDSELTVGQGLEYIALDYESEYNTTVGNKTPIYPNEKDKYGKKWTHRVDDDVYFSNSNKIKYKFRSDDLKYDGAYNDNINLKLNSNLEKVKKEEFFNDATTTYYDIYTDTESIIGKNIVTEAIVEGFASSHGKETDQNILLANNRSDFACKFVQMILDCKITNLNETKDNSSKIIKVNTINRSEESAKRGRCAKVTLKLKKGESILKLEKMTSETPFSGTTITSTTLTPKEIDRNNLTKKEKRALKKAQKEREEYVQSEEYLTEVKANALKQLEVNQPAITNAMTPEILNNNINEELSKWRKIKKTHTVTKTRKVNKINEDNTVNRWENEAQYFQMLKEKDNFLYSKIIDKIKYFTPAFHSITPEGFNARLSFLHQCTRQGHTYSVSDVNNGLNSAGNLAFGRPPICVLRIGDFYHTKIIIDSITIDYDNGGGVQWDTNQEGIGIQPMYAKISLNFKFLGGHDLGAPINRLQNAISFNYYANQSTYDDRSDIGKYNENGENVIEGKPWKPYNPFKEKK